MFFTDDAFQPFETHHHHRKTLLKAIFSDLPEQVVPMVRVFRPEKAHEVEDHLLPLFHEIAFYALDERKPLPAHTEEFARLERRRGTVKTIVETRDWLARLVRESDGEVMLSYDVQTALLTPWSMFVRHYDALCYWGLDDLLVCPLSERWVLLYYHEDVFVFGQRRMLVPREE